MKHIIAYQGKRNVALAVMQEQYVPLFLPWVNWRIGVEGTLQRPPYSLAQGIEWVKGLDKTKGTNEVFAVLLRTDTGKRRSYRYVGHMGIHNIKWPHGFATTGSIIGAAGVQGHGVGAEAKLLIQEHAFMQLGVRKLNSAVKMFNGQSLGHLLKCGYKIIGRYREHHWHEGRYVDEILLECFRADWEPIWERYQETGELPRLTDAQRAQVKEITQT